MGWRGAAKGRGRLGCREGVGPREAVYDPNQVPIRAGSYRATTSVRAAMTTASRRLAITGGR